jgi:hypothetical protein
LKLRAFLFGNCPIYRLNLALDPRNLIAGQSFDGRGVDTFNDGTSPADELFAKYE